LKRQTKIRNKRDEDSLLRVLLKILTGTSLMLPIRYTEQSCKLVVRS